MKTILLLFILISSIITSCGGDFNKSVKVDMLSGLTTKGDGLSVNDVYLSLDDDKKIKRNTFIYGEVFYLNFNDVTGFKKEGENVFPGMELTVVNEKGDTAMYYEDMYADKVDGVNVKPLLLYTNITVAKPITSNANYTLYVNIWDKKGTGIYKAEFDFDVVPNEHIKIEKDEIIAFDNIYLFSREEGTITNNKIHVGETYYLMFEGVEGFNADNGKVSVGMSMLATSADGEVLLKEKDLLGEGEWEPGLVKEQISADFIFRDEAIKTPIECEFIIFDKKSDKKIKASISLEFN